MLRNVCSPCALASVGYTAHELGMTRAEFARHVDIVSSLSIEIVSEFDSFGDCALCGNTTTTASAGVIDRAEFF